VSYENACHRRRQRPSVRSSSSGGKSNSKSAAYTNQRTCSSCEQGIVIIISKASQRCQAAAATTSTTTATGENRVLVAAARVILQRLAPAAANTASYGKASLVVDGICQLLCFGMHHGHTHLIVHLRAPFEQGKMPLTLAWRVFPLVLQRLATTIIIVRGYLENNFPLDDETAAGTGSSGSNNNSNSSNSSVSVTWTMKYCGCW
jgi:hypothetical protein